MTASGQQENSGLKTKLEFGVWHASFQHAYAKWTNAPHDLKNPLLLTGPSLASAENWLLTLPTRLSDGEKRFIIRSIAQRSGGEAVQPTSRNPVGRLRKSQRQFGIQWLVFAVLAAAIWIFTPEIVQSGLKASVYAVLDLIEPGAFRPREFRKTTRVSDAGNNGTTLHSADDPIISSGLPADEPDFDLASRLPLVAGIDLDKLARSARLQRLRQLVELSDERLRSGDPRVGALLALEAAKHVEDAERPVDGNAAATSLRPRGEADPGTAAPFAADSTVDSTVAETRQLIARAHANIRHAMTRRTSLSTSLHAELTAGPTAMFCPTGRILLTVPAKQTIEAWDVTADRRIMTLTGRRSLFRGASFDPSCERLLLTEDDHVAEIFSLADGRRIAVLEGHEASVLATAWSRDGSTVLTASQDSTARLWNARTARLLLVLEGHADFVVAAALSPDGRLALTASSDKSARIWNTRNGHLLHILGQHRDIVTDASFSPTGRQVLTTSWDGEARIWDAISGKRVRSFRSSGGAVMMARFAAGGSRLVTMTQRSVVQVWNIETGSLVSTLASRSSTVASDTDLIRTFDLDARGNRLVTTSWKGSVKHWRTSDGTMIAELVNPSRRAEDVSISIDGDRLSAIMTDGALESWPLFARLDQAIGQVRRDMGRCLSSAERDSLGLPPEQPAWCRDSAG